MEKKKDFWEYAKKKLLTDKLIVRVKEFKEDKIKAIPQAKIDKLKVFIHNPLFERERVIDYKLQTTNYGKRRDKA